MRTVKFKKPGQKIGFVKGGREINESNLTIEAYDDLVKRNPNYKRLFIVTEDEPVKTHKTKPEKTE